MSGIGGFFAREGAVPMPAPIARLAGALARRGAGDEGLDGRGPVVLLHRTTRTGPAVQPLADPWGVLLVSDGAVDPAPVPLYRVHGVEFARHLQGGHALALFDAETGRLLLVRDGFGIKPLYYAETPDGFVFASTVTALLATGLVPAALVRKARDELLQLQFTTGRTTPFAGICRVLPGETVIVEHARVVDRRSYRLLPVAAPLPAPAEPALDMLDRLLSRAVAHHCEAEGPVGLFLSGGVETTALLAAMAAHNQGQGQVEALSLAVAQPDAERELGIARAVAAAVGARLTEVTFREADFWHLLPEVAAAVDDPMADMALVPQWKLARAAAELGFRTILAGEGGDELFGGHDRYRRLLRPWWAGGRAPRAHGMFDDLDLLRDGAAGGDPGGARAWRTGLHAAEAAQRIGARTRLQQVQAADCQEWLPNGQLARFDRALAAHGLEGRLPLLDRAVAQFAFGLPDELKIRRGVGKWLLRRWLHQRLPEARALVQRRRASIPVGAWLARRGAMLGPLVARQAPIREICEADAVERLFARINDQQRAFAAWNLLFYALWHRANIAGLPPERDVFQTLSNRD